MAGENEEMATTSKKSISAYTDYHKDEQGQTIADVSYFKEHATLPVSGKYTENGDMQTKSVSLSELTAQADWNEDDTNSKAFIKNKPANIGKGIIGGAKIKIELDPNDGTYKISYDENKQ